MADDAWLCRHRDAWNEPNKDDICWRCNTDRPTERERSMTTTTTPPNAAPDRTRLLAAFMDLRARGYWARENQRDGMKAVPENVIKGGKRFAVTDEAETGKFDADGPGGNLLQDVHVHHRSQDAREIAEVLCQHGLDAEIRRDGDLDEVVIVPREDVGNR